MSVVRFYERIGAWWQWALIGLAGGIGVSVGEHAVGAESRGWERAGFIWAAGFAAFFAAATILVVVLRLFDRYRDRPRDKPAAES